MLKAWHFIVVAIALCASTCSSFSVEDSQVARPRSRFAYVALHYEGTPKDEEYLLGLRVLIKSIQQTGTKHDIVVLASDVRDSTIDTLRNDDGVIVKLMPNLPNPYRDHSDLRRSYKSRFEHTFNKLYLWNMTEYERVVYLDSDNIALTNMDDMFLCGHFCVVFLNPINFHTGLIIVKPDSNVFSRIVHALVSKTVYSYDGADQGFLTAYFPNVEAAPLFEPGLSKDGRPSDEPVMRLPLGYNTPAVYYYIRFNWDIFRRDRQPFANNTVPLLSLGFPIMPLMKPWYWWPTVYFDANWLWDDVRSQVGPTYLDMFTLRLLLLPFFLLGYDVVIRLMKMSKLGHSFAQIALKCTNSYPMAFSVAVGSLSMTLVVSLVGAYIVPFTIPPRLGWALFVPWTMAGLYCAWHSYTTLLVMASDAAATLVTVGGKDMSASASAAATHNDYQWWPLGFFLVADAIALSAALGPFYSFFVAKILTVFGVVIGNLVLKVYTFKLTADICLRARITPSLSLPSSVRPISIS